MTTDPPASSREKDRWESKQLPVKKISGSRIHHFCSHPISQKLVTWPHLNVRKAARRRLLLGSRVSSWNRMAAAPERKGGADPGAALQPGPVMLSLATSGFTCLQPSSPALQLTPVCLRLSPAFLLVSCRANPVHASSKPCISFFSPPATSVRSPCLESNPLKSIPSSASRVTPEKSKPEPLVP